jgi:hypothetical protein
MKGCVRLCGVTETCVGSVILLGLAAIAIGVFVKQSHYDRAMFLPVMPSASSNKPSAAAVPASGSIVDLPPELVPLSAPETFSADNLYDKIDGKAELYTSAGVLGMRCQRFALKSDPNIWAEFFLYDMDNLRQSFAVYSQQRRAEAQPLDLTAYAYRTQNALFFCSGRYYVEAITATPVSEMMSAMLSLAREFVGKNPAPNTRLAEPDLFPPENLAPNSYMFQPADAFGFDQFKNVFSATYKVNGVDVMAFLIIRSTPQEAAALSAAYQQFLRNNGGKNLTGTGKVPNGSFAELLGSVELVFSRGNVVGGVHAAPNLEAAEQVGARLYEKIPEATK